MVKFHIADSTQTVSLSITVADMLAQRPELFREDIKIASFFGSPSLIWNGGRNIFGYFSAEKTKAVLDAYNGRGIPYRFTFTNPSLTEKDLEDPDCNLVLDMADNGINEVIVNSPLLEKYIRQTHPRMKITSSTCKCIRDMDGVKAELAKDYSLVVLDYNFNNNFEELEKLTLEERRRCELLANTFCVPDCKRRSAHYKFIGDMQRRLPELRAMTEEELSREKLHWECPYYSYRPYVTESTPLRISPEDLYGKYKEMGFENFKIEGRTSNMMILCEQLAEYMAAPGKRRAFRCDVMIVALDYYHLNFG